MPVKYSVSSGGFIQDASATKIDFYIDGELSQPVLESLGAPVYNKNSFTINSAKVAIDSAQIGNFDISIRSYATNGSGEVIQASGTITVVSAGTIVTNLTINNSTIAADRIVRILAKHNSGSPSSNISVTLE